MQQVTEDDGPRQDQVMKGLQHDGLGQLQGLD